MVYGARPDQKASSTEPTPRVTPAAGTAWAVWAAAFAVGALIHSWQGLQANLTVGLIGTVVAVASVALLLRPGSPARLMVLFAALLVEIVLDLPDLVNHLVIVAMVGLVVLPWWLVLRWRRPDVARDPAEMYTRVGPFLRVTFILAFAFAALAKVNSGFLDVVGTCSAWILGSIPFVHVPTPLVPAASWGTIALETAIPLFLLFHRTRPIAIVLGFGFHLISAFAGHASFSGVAWCFYVLFLPPSMLAAAVRTAADTVPARVAGIVVRARANPVGALSAFAIVWILADVVVGLLPGESQWRVHWMSAAVLCTVWMGLTAWVLVVHRDEWVPARRPRASLRVRQPLMLLGLALLVFVALMPYLGLKTRASFTMFSNLRTEPGHWNHLLLPEAMRVFHWQDGEVRFLGTDDPDLDRAIAEHTEDGRTVLLEARRVVARHPEVTVRYELNGVERLASPVSDDDVLGVPPSPLQSWIGAMRPYTDEPRCQH